jgi:hypothetical protein
MASESCPNYPFDRGFWAKNGQIKKELPIFIRNSLISSGPRRT